jgi:hypothetical protein
MFKLTRLFVPLTIALGLLSACYPYPYYPPPPQVNWVDTPSGKAVTVGGAIREPKVIKRVNPAATNSSGLVQARLLIGPDGTVRNVDILSATDGAAAQSAKDALSQWTFTRTYVDGTAVPVVHELKITFK